MEPVILLVDDETDLVEVLRDAVELSLPGYRAIAATSVEGAWAALEHTDPNDLALVCVDHRLGATTGIELLRVVHRRWPRVPLMVFTGQATAEVHAASRELGCPVVVKPLRLSEWIAEVRRLLPATQP